MAWIKIASGTKPDNIQELVPVGELPKGTEFLINIDTGWFPSGPLADLVGAELIAELFVRGADVIDVSGPAWNKVRVDCVSDPISLVGIIIALGALGLLAYMISKIEIWANIAKAVADTAMWIAVGIMAFCGVMLVSRIPKRRET